MPPRPKPEGQCLGDKRRYAAIESSVVPVEPHTITSAEGADTEVPRVAVTRNRASVPTGKPVRVNRVRVPLATETQAEPVKCSTLKTAD